MHQTIVAPPLAGEYAPYYEKYIQLVSGDPVAALRSQLPDTLRLLARLSDHDALARYAPGKWSVKQVVGHLSDSERVFAYRALRIARGDETPLPGYEENDYAERAGSDRRPLAELTGELGAVRAATVALLESLTPEDFQRRGTANNNPISVRALAYILAGHELHHRSVLRDKYGLS